MKSAATLEELVARSIPLADGAGMLVPVCELHAGDERLIASCSAAGASESAFAFPTQFPVTHDGTATWLRAVCSTSPGRILFLVQDRFGHTVGHLGFASADERRPLARGRQRRARREGACSRA